MKKLLFINILLIFCLKLYSNSIDFKGYPTKIQLNNVRVRRKKPHSANREKPIFDKRKEPKLPESDLLFRVIQAVPLQEQPLFF